ncbi:MAG: glucose-1-phosphate adenylyltransferase subunit GlgD [Lachnospiraceae bacterium]|nr:glucose-1-phosphate adenylyltransferase subunit GlgD [Lachnospiraceae bacterium]
MIKSNQQDALGIIFANSYDKEVSSLVNERLMASIPFASRYRLIDFNLSSMVNSNIHNITVIVRKNYRSLLRHIGAGRPWDLSRKQGGLNVVPPYAEKNVKVYYGRVEALASILLFLKQQREEYVFITDSNIAFNFDYRAMLAFHKANNADVTIAYRNEAIPYGFMNLQTTATSDLYYTLSMNDGRVTSIHTNPKDYGPQNLSMNIYLIRRELLIQQIEQSYADGKTFFERDILSPKLDQLRVYGYEFKGYAARITDMVSYYNENMKLLDPENLHALFSPSKVYTTVRDDNPTRYIGSPKVHSSMVADGCIIEGTVENCVLFRGVKIGKGTVIRNSVIMQDTVIAGNCTLDYLIADKNVEISSGTELKGSPSFPLFIPGFKQI